jgi:hypothetical protein
MDSRLVARLMIVLTIIVFPVQNLVTGRLAPSVSADDAEDVAAKKLALERKERYTKWMRTYAEETKVRLTATKGDQGQDGKLAELVPNPVFRYSDEEHRIPDATLWVWTDEGRPVAFQKVEGNNHGGGQLWTICFASLTEGFVNVDWPMNREFNSHNPGITFQPITGAERPSENALLRTAQIKGLKDQFSARFGVTAAGTGGSEARILPRPLFEYADPKTKMPWGAIFGMSSTGTNPSALLLIEARPDQQGELEWKYALARMTTYSVRASVNNTEVWSEPEGNNLESGRWTYFFLQREFP